MKIWLGNLLELLEIKHKIMAAAINIFNSDLSTLTGFYLFILFFLNQFSFSYNNGICFSFLVVSLAFHG